MSVTSFLHFAYEWSASPALAQGSDHVYQVTFVARWGPAYTDVYANLLRSNIMESLHDLGPDSQYADPGLLVNPVYEDAGVQLACHPLPGWQFTLGRYYETRAVTGAWGSLSRVTGPFLTDIITQRSAPLLDEHGNIVQGRRLAGRYRPRRHRGQDVHRARQETAPVARPAARQHVKEKH